MRTLFLLWCSAFLVSCHDPKEATRENFAAAMEQYFAKHGQLCVHVGEWPVEISLSSSWSHTPQTAAQLTALEALGLAVSGEVEVESKPSEWSLSTTVVKRKVTRYELTDKGRQSMGPPEPLRGPGICYGQKALEQIEKWEGPLDLRVVVKYTYKVVDLAEWARREEFRTAFPYAVEIIEGRGIRQHGLKLTSEGWEALGMDNGFG